jgi:Nif-specific regulatory protein
MNILLDLFSEPLRATQSRDAQMHTDRTQLERDIYRRLLDVRSEADSRDIVGEVLTRGFVECRSMDGKRRVLAATGMEQDGVDNILTRISTGIVAETLSQGAILHTTSAVFDERFNQFVSVRTAAIQAVACAPIQPGLGVVYLQGPNRFDEEALQVVERVAGALAPLIARDVIGAGSQDPTTKWRSMLKAKRVVGRSNVIADVLRHAALFAAQPVTVLLTGPTGTGKSMLARVIHDSSPQSKGPFVSINCATLPATLAESELFGAEAGAHSTAVRRLPGKVDAAAGGTLFLDEVGELPPEVQAKILEFIQSGSYHRLGSSKQQRSATRIIAATNRDLNGDMRTGAFREDLFHRLAGFSIRVPPLSERREDITAIADSLLNRACSEMEVPVLRLHRQAAVELAVREWTGNIRELNNAIRRAAVFAASEGVNEVMIHHFQGSTDSPTPATYGDATRAFQRQLLVTALAAADGNVAAASQQLGLARSHVYALIKEHGVRE